MVPKSRGCLGGTFAPTPASPVCTGLGTGRTRAGGPCGIVPRSRGAQVRGRGWRDEGSARVKGTGGEGTQRGVWGQEGCDTNLCRGRLDPPEAGDPLLAPPMGATAPHGAAGDPPPPSSPVLPLSWGFQVTWDTPPKPFWGSPTNGTSPRSAPLAGGAA